MRVVGTQRRDLFLQLYVLGWRYRLLHCRRVYKFFSNKPGKQSATSEGSLSSAAPEGERRRENAGCFFPSILFHFEYPPRNGRLLLLHLPLSIYALFLPVLDISDGSGQGPDVVAGPRSVDCQLLEKGDCAILTFGYFCEGALCVVEGACCSVEFVFYPFEFAFCFVQSPFYPVEFAFCLVEFAFSHFQMIVSLVNQISCGSHLMTAEDVHVSRYAGTGEEGRVDEC